MSDLFKEECVYVYEGIVEAGDRRGRTLGFPTANIPITAAADIGGVWAGLVETGPETFAIAAVSVGRRRTFRQKCAHSRVQAQSAEYARRADRQRGNPCFLPPHESVPLQWRQSAGLARPGVQEPWR